MPAGRPPKYPAICLVDGCENPSRRAGLCGMHSHRFYRYGDTSTNKYPGRESLEKSFWAKTQKGAATDCWPWIGAINSSGYGSMRHNYATLAAHRVGYELVKGPIPDGLHIDHLCGNRSCVNPSHLEAVTHAVNMARAKVEQCFRGHPYTPENTRINSRGYRECRTCMKLIRATHREKSRQLKAHE